MTRAEGILGVWDLRSGSWSKVALTGRRATDPPMEGGHCDAAVAEGRDFGLVLAGAGRSVDDSRCRFEDVDVDVDAVPGRGGGGMGECCARDGFRVEAPVIAPAPPVAVVRGTFALLVVPVTAGVFDPPD